MTESGWIRIPCIELQQRSVGFMSVRLIATNWLDIVADRRRIEKGERDVEIISGIQRPLAPKRISELREICNKY